MIDCNDSVLVRRLKQGEEAAFTELVNKYKVKAFGIVYNFVHNVDDAKELSQDAFVKVYYSIGRFKENSSFFTWFYRILINVCIDHGKKRRISVIPFSQIRGADGIARSCVVDSIEDKQARNPLRILLSGELNQRISQAIDSLSERQRIVFILRHFENLSINEIAEHINCSEGTVKSHLARAVKKLQELLGHLSRQAVEEERGEPNEQVR
ncbi:MAG: sigma-70 family RNA polymerase sigma factor [Candidatus Omnitrophica bacterium]|nr:sigma-70 family RNA polymerase sigma factor [Candidatus Omnitrophota bacterium]